MDNETSFLHLEVSIVVASCLKFQEDQTKPDTGDYNTHGCCCCALLRRADSSPVSRQLKIKQPATDTEGGYTGDLRLIPKNSTKARRKRTATKV